jgi:hypothetical protein
MTSRKVDWMWKANMFNASGFFSLLGKLQEYVYAVPLRTTEHLGAIFKAVVTAVNANVLRRAGDNALHCLLP